MSCKIFVGNLPWKTTSGDLLAILRGMGYAPRPARVVEERDTGRSRGFAFVEFDTPQAAAEATRNLDGHVVEGRALRASEADEKTRGGSARDGRGGGGSRGGGGGRGGDFEVWD